MSDLRTAALRALEYLDAPSSKLWPAGTHYQIITALRAALADQNRGWYTVDEINAKFAPDPVLKPEPPPEAQTEAEKIAYCAGWWAALEKARTAEPEPCRYPDCVDNGPDGKCTRWLLAECSMSEDYKPQRPAAPIIKPEIKADKPFGYFRAEPFGWTDCAPTDEGAIPLYERPQAQQFLYNAWADEQIQKEKK